MQSTPQPNFSRGEVLIPFTGFGEPDLPAIRDFFFSMEAPVSEIILCACNRGWVVCHSQIHTNKPGSQGASNRPSGHGCCRDCHNQNLNSGGKRRVTDHERNAVGGGVWSSVLVLRITGYIIYSIVSEFQSREWDGRTARIDGG